MDKYKALKEDVMGFSTRGGFKDWNWTPLDGDWVQVEAEVRKGMEAEWARISTRI